MSAREERVAAISRDILAVFETGEVPAAMAQVFIRRNVAVPSRHWSFTNRLIGHLRGHVYAAGFRQWQILGRSVKPGERAFHIFGPCLVPDNEKATEEAGEVPRVRLVGFVPIPVFGYLQTDGKPLPGLEDEPSFVDALPLVAVARFWGLSVGTYSAADFPGILGHHLPGKGIGLGVKNLSVWAHELIHAADTRLGHPKDSLLANEVVAQLGGAILLESLGYATESDRGGCLAYLERYARHAGRTVLPVALELLD